MLHGSFVCNGSAAIRSESDRSLETVEVTIDGLPTFTGALKATLDQHGVRLGLGIAFRERGVRVLDDIHGTFALVLKDPDKNALLMATDRIGIESLCYGIVDNVMHYATEASTVASALRNDHALDTSSIGGLDPQSIFDYLYFHCIPAPATVFRGVSRLLPGHAIQMTSAGVTVLPYWSPSYTERDDVPLPALEETFLSTVRASVARAIEGASRPACFLSGGTDSSTVAGMLREVTGAPPQGYSIGFDAEGFDEMHYARVAAKRYGVAHREYYIAPADLVASIPDIAAAYDQPFGNSSVLPTYYCAKLAKADGVDRMLGGDGGDELFGGNTRYAKQRVFDYFDRAPTVIQGVLRGALSPQVWESVPVVKKARSYIQQASVPMPDRTQSYNLLMRVGLDRIFEPSFLDQVDTARPVKEMRAWYARSDATSLVNRMLALDLKYTLTDNDLPKVVTACRVAGVDAAFPLLDDALVEFAAKLDPDLKLKGLKLRWFFKHALRNFLPAEILTKSKHGFGLPFGIWLGRDKALHELAFASLESLKGRGIVRAAFIDQLRADLLLDHATYYGELVWVLMMLEQWLQTHGVGHEALAQH